MDRNSVDHGTSLKGLLAKVTRYEALFELTGVMSAAADVDSVGAVLARRLKYIADVHSWRYVGLDAGPDETAEPEQAAVVIDGFRGRAERAPPDSLSRFEQTLWQDHKTRILSGDEMHQALHHLPEHLRRDDLEQIAVNVLVEGGQAQALQIFCKRRRPFSELDLKCLAMVCGFFHGKVRTLWEQEKLRKLELAYLQQEVMLRESAKLATLGRLSAGMAHELNNPAAAAQRGAEQLRATIDRLERTQFALGASGLSPELVDEIARLRAVAQEKSEQPLSSDSLDEEEATEDWLERHGVPDSWELAPALAAMGLGTQQLDGLEESFGAASTTILTDYLASRFVAHSQLADLGRGTRRISEIVDALKGYSYMDQGPVQSIDVRAALDDTLTMLASRLGSIDVRLHYGEDVPTIQGRGVELNQVWTNLIDNAVGAMDGSGSLELRALRDGDWVVVEVADSGPGIPVEDQERVFDPFYTTKPPGEGAGLGLSVSHTIVVEKHRGQISLTSKPGDTRFTVKLPIHDPETA